MSQVSNYWDRLTDEAIIFNFHSYTVSEDTDFKSVLGYTEITLGNILSFNDFQINGKESWQYCGNL